MTETGALLALIFVVLAVVAHMLGQFLEGIPA